MRRLSVIGFGAAALVLSAVLAIVAPVRSAQAFDLGQLVRELKLTERHEVGFLEERTLEALTTKLTSTGRFVFEPPDRLIKKMATPRREQAVIQDGRLTIMDADGATTASVALADHPAPGGVFLGLLALLRGDEKTLTEIFVPELSGDASAWTLRLKPVQPRSDNGQAGLDHMVVTGGAEIRTLEIRETGGDHTHITLLPEPASR